MGLHFCSLSSSSVHGNCYLVRSDDGTVVMIDAGIRLRRLEALLPAVGVQPGAVNAIFITHEHSDHTAALRLRKPFAVRHGIQVYAEPIFWRQWDAERAGEMPRELRRDIAAGETVRVGGLMVRAVGKPHDTRSSVGFIISDGTDSLAVLTDLGHVPDEVALAVGEVNYLVMESNHDVELERGSGRPWPLVQRVLGPRGHLSNEQSLAALCRIAGPVTRLVLLAHLSLECNTPELALRVVGDGLAAAGRECAVEVAAPDGPSGWLPRI